MHLKLLPSFLYPGLCFLAYGKSIPYKAASIFGYYYSWLELEAKKIEFLTIVLI